jgi:hypothetical protein
MLDTETPYFIRKNMRKDIYILSWNWSKDSPFIFKKDVINKVWAEYQILEYMFGEYSIKEQRLIQKNWKSIDELDVEYKKDDLVEITTLYFDLS